jgi:type VI secretion system protein ImpL
MQDAIQHPDRYASGEEWVLKSTSPPMERGALTANLNTVYTADFIKAWHDYLNKAQVIPFSSFKDAAEKLGQFDSNTSPLLELFSLVSVNTGAASPEISAAFQAPQAVVLPTFKPGDLLISQKTNQTYINSLINLQGAVDNLANNPIGQNDPTAAQPVLQNAETARGAAKGLSNTFNPNSYGIDKTSAALLEAPIKSAEDLAAEAPLRAAGGGAKQFCDEANKVLAKFPFNPQATIDASPEEAAQIFAPGSGAFSQYYNTTLRALVIPQGARYISNPGSKFQISRSFLDFVASSQKITTTLFAMGNTPSLDFSLTEVKTGAPDAVLNIDGQEIKEAGQRASFHWVSKSESKMSLSAGGNSSVQAPGPWSLFHFWFPATHVPPDLIKYSLQSNNQTNVIVTFDATGSGAALLNPQFMKAYRCVSTLH